MTGCRGAEAVIGCRGQVRRGAAGRRRTDASERRGGGEGGGVEPAEEVGLWRRGVGFHREREAGGVVLVVVGGARAGRLGACASAWA